MTTRQQRFNARQSPGDLDDTPLKPILEFDLRRPWPERYFNQRFGPTLIRKAINGGWMVFAEVADVPYPVAIKEAQWTGDVLKVITLEGPRIAERLFTRKLMKNVTSSGLLMERKET